MRHTIPFFRRSAFVPAPGSSLLNPRSQRAKVRRMVAAQKAQGENFERQALYAELGGSPSARAPRSKGERSKEATRRVGCEVAERAKHMTDAEWEGVPVDEKHAFAKYMHKVLQEHPTETTEQQRRRYFETTMADVFELDPRKTVRDEYERVKLGLPVHLKNPQYSLGVSQAVYDAADASLFDPENVHRLENAMTHVKQVFADYVHKKREGVSTEAERRMLANLTAELNLETQKHLANMFKYAEMRLRQVKLEERHHQLAEIERLRRMAQQRGGVKGRKGGSRKMSRMERLKRVINRAVGLDIAVAETVLTEMQAQEEFLQFCEVFARLTLGSGFKHTGKDENLSAYIESLRKLYSMDAATLSTLDVVQYYSSKEGAHPVDWAKRWYERALLLPLQSTPEYQKLLQIQQRDESTVKHIKETAGTGHAFACEAEAEVARIKTQKVVNLVEKMFMDPKDKRLESLHEKRLRYLAHMQMERQIRCVRENAKLFDGVENMPEAAQCRELYEKIMEKKTAQCNMTSPPEGEGSAIQSAKTEGDHCEVGPGMFNVYDDAEASSLFEKIREITLRVIRDRRVQSAAATKARMLNRIIRTLKGGEQSIAEELRALHQQRKEKMTMRILGIIENDVKTEMEWLQNMEEAERPPLLPIPENMSYVSAADVQAWRELREDDERKAANPFERRRRTFQPELLGQAWSVPNKPLLFWGTGVSAVQQALRHVAEDAERKRQGLLLAPPYPCAENPWGWRLAKDILDDNN
ncbi:kinteoplast poly(A) polymerase complex 1 subunit [Trypanosoma equiperdum]|uniref:Kinteoplast poly(A) polymerase complex 1 subunit n=1 Tax=Trypanosoma equiperdum TaxID=5694 RepID=A0A1G4IDU8_TRYEQ|nr:kinteoplast poly(A) polymerase complex 1 subunit [Trypanosoma equiperdum]